VHWLLNAARSSKDHSGNCVQTQSIKSLGFCYRRTEKSFRAFVKEVCSAFMRQLRKAGDKQVTTSSTTSPRRLGFCLGRAARRRYLVSSRQEVRLYSQLRCCSAKIAQRSARRVHYSAWNFACALRFNGNDLGDSETAVCRQRKRGAGFWRKHSWAGAKKTGQLEKGWPAL
jgi:hypothetical protein